MRRPIRMSHGSGVAFTVTAGPWAGRARPQENDIGRGLTVVQKIMQDRGGEVCRPGRHRIPAHISQHD
jgi:hypothetical protein